MGAAAVVWRQLRLDDRTCAGTAAVSAAVAGSCLERCQLEGQGWRVGCRQGRGERRGVPHRAGGWTRQAASAE